MTTLKNRFQALLMAAALTMLFTGKAQAVQFTYFDSGFHSQSDAYANNGIWSDGGPPADAHWDSQNASGSALAAAIYASAEGKGSGEWISSAPNSLDISLSGMAYGSGAYPSESGWAYGNAPRLRPRIPTVSFSGSIPPAVRRWAT